MFKKILSLALAVMMIMSVTAIVASAAEVDAADQGAEADVAATGANVITYDNSVTNWAGPVKFYIYDPDSGAELIAWGSKKLNGTDNGDGTWSKDISDYGLESGKQYCIIFNDGASNDQTYDLIMDSSCIGDTAKATGESVENPVDSNKTAKIAKWNNSSLGPRMQVTSIGNVVGETIPSFTNKTKMFSDFLTNTLSNARTFSGKDDQKLLDDTASALGLTKDEVEAAIKETGVSTEWSKDKSSLSGGSSSGGSGSSDSSSSGSGSSGSGSSGSGSSGSGSSGSGNSGSGSNTQTGQSETLLFIMLGVMVLAAGVIFFARKRERA